MRGYLKVEYRIDEDELDSDDQREDVTLFDGADRQNITPEEALQIVCSIEAGRSDDLGSEFAEHRVLAMMDDAANIGLNIDGLAWDGSHQIEIHLDEVETLVYSYIVTLTDEQEEVNAFNKAQAERFNTPAFSQANTQSLRNTPGATRSWRNAVV